MEGWCELHKVSMQQRWRVRWRGFEYLLTQCEPGDQLSAALDVVVVASHSCDLPDKSHAGAPQTPIRVVACDVQIGQEPEVKWAEQYVAGMPIMVFAGLDQ